VRITGGQGTRHKKRQSVVLVVCQFLGLDTKDMASFVVARDPAKSIFRISHRLVR
jgi:hypothetical protein